MQNFKKLSRDKIKSRFFVRTAVKEISDSDAGQKAQKSGGLDGKEG